MLVALVLREEGEGGEAEPYISVQPHSSLSLPAVGAVGMESHRDVGHLVLMSSITFMAEVMPSFTAVSARLLPAPDLPFALPFHYS